MATTLNFTLYEDNVNLCPIVCVCLLGSNQQAFLGAASLKPKSSRGVWFDIQCVSPLQMSSTTITVNITVSPSSKKFKVVVEKEATVEELKSECAKEGVCDAETVRLIYKGHVLRDGRTLSSYCESFLCFCGGQ